MTTLTEFLSARLDEDEAAALGAKGDTPGVWDDDGDPATWIVLYDKSGKLTLGQHRHIARHDPARVLREVAAKRAIIELADEASGLDQSVDLDRRVGPRDMQEEPFVGDLILRQLAAVYSDQPEYREEWKP